jgi:hypothetical protein
MNDNPAIGRHRREIAKLEGVEQFYSAIGRFVVEFSRLESVFKILIADATKLPQEYEDVIIGHDFAMLCTIAENVLSRKMNEDRKTHLRTAINKARDLNNHRVRIVHGRWMIGNRSGELHHISRQKLEPRDHYRGNPSEVAAQADIAIELYEELQEFWEP